MANNELGYPPPESDFLDEENPYLEGLPADHPNFYEESVSVGEKAGDRLTDALKGLFKKMTDSE